MEILQLLDAIDKEWLLAINGCHNSFFDSMMYWISDRLVWVPLYVSMLWMIFSRRRIGVLPVIAAVVLTVLLADQFASGFCKPFFMRFRPANSPEIGDMVHVVNGIRGDLYGFCSSHAANTVGIAVLLSLIVRKRWLAVMLSAWAFANCYSRAYMGLHYPGDLLCGALTGATAGFFSYWLYTLALSRWPRIAGKPGNIDCTIAYQTMAVTLFLMIVFSTKGFIV